MHDDVTWFEAHPGDRALTLPEEPTAVLIYDGNPDWVRLPAELGGSAVRVIGRESGACPCRGPHSAVTLLLESSNLRVAECLSTKQFYWFRVPPQCEHRIEENHE